VEISVINTAYNSLRFVRDSLSLALNAKVDEEARSKIYEAMERVTSLQDGLFNTQQELLSLQAENEALKKQIAAANTWKERASLYKLVKTSGGALVYEFQGQPAHYVCPSCYEVYRIAILQDTAARERLWECVTCKTSFKLLHTAGRGYRG